MEMALLIGIPASGKSSFYQERFGETHVRLNLDMLTTRPRLRILRDACFAAKARFVIDNTNLTRAERAEHIVAARAHRFAVTGYYFESNAVECARRNADRPEAGRVPTAAIFGARKRLEVPKQAEGFDALHFVRLYDGGRFSIDVWRVGQT